MDQPLRLGLAGLGTVGTSVIRLLRDHEEALTDRAGRPLRLVAVSARNPNKDRGISLDGLSWHSDPVALASSPDIDCFIELIGGENGVCREATRAALDSGKSVVTANKALLAKHGLELAAAAEKGGGVLAFEAAVGGGIPIVKVLREALAGNRITRLFGILNGTCNYILTRMEAEGLSFEQCLADAQELGYAEADPSFDIDGLDAAHKLAILTSLAFGVELNKDAIFVEGIASITAEDIAAAEELGYRIKLLAVAQETDSGIEQRVHPTMLPKNSQLARISDVTNAVAVEGDFIGQVVLSGPGAGGDATASAVVGDIVDCARGFRAPPFGRPVASLKPYERARMRAHAGGYYLRLSVPDRVGAFAAIARAMADGGISLDSIVQRNRPAGAAPRGNRDDLRSITIITHDTTEQAVRDALGRIEGEGDIVGRPQMIRIEAL
ncbi:homoserine dehydrogenase [Afifella sp. JA880]|uniref:homoserine dehydrogenase n=1 Tax=Afifella sp. JA880 TaxID=2975280 RepID=UPI0021BAA5FF|nr:homoserine dehydrogenase [Afifella sp. JA880]MCT8265893.1 homoserine dehydrogenase [Afifella sp. JA880]